MKVNLSQDELNLLLSSIGLALNVLNDQTARQQLEALQTKLMAVRDGQ
mgnify:CR=1 FL=1